MEKAKTRQEIACACGLSARTLTRKLQQKNIHLPNGLVSPHDQRRILEALGFNPPRHPKQ